MPLIPIEIAPGIVTEQTARGARNRWRDCNRVRFRNFLPEKLGGWSENVLSGEAIAGIVRGALDWRTIANVANTAIGTHTKLFRDRGGLVENITPYRLATDAFGGVDTELTDPFDTTDGSAVVNVSHSAHGVSVGDTVYFDGASAVGGITIDGEYTVTSVVGVDDFTITHSSAATSTANGGGTVDYAYEINVGSTSGQVGLGWGAGTWGTGTWGTPRGSSSITFPPRTWSLDTWGEDLIANPRNGGIYVWDASITTPHRAALIANAPSEAAFIIVSPVDRHLIALGCTPIGGSAQDPLVLRWSSQNDYTDWTPSRTNTSRQRRLDNASRLISALRVREEILILTDDSLFAMTFTGPPAMFNIRRLGGQCGITGPLARGEYGGVAYWMGIDEFWMYDGALAVMQCPVHDHVFDDINLAHSEKFHAGSNSLHYEMFFFYCSAGASEPDRYVLYNVLERTWAFGELDRTAWLDRSVVRTRPAAFDADSNLYNHESGNSANGAAMGDFLESYDFEIDGAGDSLFFMRKLVPDLVEQEGNILVTVKGRKYPHGPQVARNALTLTPTTPYVRPRLRARQGSIRIESDPMNPNAYWRTGMWRADGKSDGHR